MPMTTPATTPQKNKPTNFEEWKNTAGQAAVRMWNKREEAKQVGTHTHFEVETSDTPPNFYADHFTL